MLDRKLEARVTQNDTSLEVSADRLSDARRQFAGQWNALRSSLRLETGTEPRWKRNLVLPVLALAAGVAVGAGVWWRRSKAG